MPNEVNGTEFVQALRTVATATEAMLEEILPACNGQGMSVAHQQLQEAMRYSTLGPGKRLRAFLTVTTADMFAVPRSQSLRVAAAIECVHAYSLVHDDLPAMDGDDLRRGLPTGHRVFGEAMAILAGDALQSLAFEVLADGATHPEAAVRTDLLGQLATAIGADGMAGGQAMDLQPEPDAERIRETQERKTGALIRYSCWAGGRLGNASTSELHALAGFGLELGRAYQIRDDLLDIEGEEHVAGKRLGKDHSAGKQTFVSYLGVETARSRLAESCNMACTWLQQFNGRAASLHAVTEYVSVRDR